MATIDLKTLPKWKELPYGNHTLQIVARAPERGDSDKSEGVTFTTRRMTISDTVNPRATRLTLDIYDGETLKNHTVYSIAPGSYFMMPSLSDIQGTVKFIGWLDDGTFNASDLSAITYGTGINPFSDRYGAVWQSATYASKDDVPLSMVIDETAKAFATVRFNFASVPEGTANIMAVVNGFYPNIYNAFNMRPVDASEGVRTTTNDLTSLTTTMFVPKSETTQAEFGVTFTALDLDGNELGATEQIKVESVSTETVTEVQATFPKSLEESTWAEIAQVSANKQWNAMGWNVGDSKTITLNGTVGTLALNNYQCKVYIIGFDHNAEKEGQGISFGLLEGMDGKQLCLVDQYENTSPSEVMASFSMNTTPTNVGGWKTAKMRKTILGSTDVENGDATPNTIANPATNTLMAALPADLRAVLKPITKYTNNVGKSSDASAVSPSIDYLPLMAEFEVFGVQTKANPNEKTYQAQYEYYKSENSKIKYKQNDVASTALWWLRSPAVGGFASWFCIVDIDGMAYNMNPQKSYGVAPAFLV